MKKNKNKNVRHPGIEPGPPRWQRGIIATRLMAQKVVRRPGIEPGPPAWKAGILTTELSTLVTDRVRTCAGKAHQISSLAP